MIKNRHSYFAWLAAIAVITGVYEASHWFVTIGTAQEVRNMLCGGQVDNYRMLDLEVHQYAYPTGPALGKNTPPEVTALPDEICALLVTNEGQQSTPAWDFIVYATPIDLFVWGESFERFDAVDRQ